jgi:surface antigen
VALVAALSLIAASALSSTRQVVAEEIRPAQPAPCTCSTPEQTPKATPRPKLADHSRDLDAGDEIATLEAIRVALSEVGDGATFVWHRNNGRLSGIVRPTASFKDASGRVCRHIVLVLTAGLRTARAEGVACRSDDGRWQLEG